MCGFANSVLLLNNLKSSFLVLSSETLFHILLIDVGKQS